MCKVFDSQSISHLFAFLFRWLESWLICLVFVNFMLKDWMGCFCRQSQFALILFFSCSFSYFFALWPFAYVPGSLLNRIPLRPLAMESWLTSLPSFLTHLQIGPFHPGQFLYFMHKFWFRFRLLAHQFLMLFTVKFIYVWFSRLILRV